MAGGARSHLTLRAKIGSSNCQLAFDPVVCLQNPQQKKKLLLGVNHSWLLPRHSNITELHSEYKLALNFFSATSQTASPVRQGNRFRLAENSEQQCSDV